MKGNEHLISAALKFAAFTVVITLLALAASVSANGSDDPLLSLVASSDKAKESRITVIIDAGHGGFDGGATAEAESGTVLEKDVNLSIAKRLYFLFRTFGIDCVMTRTEDVMLGEGKAFDLKNRLELAKKYENPVFISVHQNKFPDRDCRGLQVYYSKNNGDSEILALFIQNVVRAYLDPQNGRKIKKADSSIYLLDRLTCPAVLVECGFMSNEEELGLLTSAEYQKKLASAIFAATVEFCGQISESDFK